MALIEPPAGSFSRRESVLAGILAVVAVSNICAAIFFFASKSQQSNLSSLHTVFEAHLASAKFIDLTHPIEPGMPMWAAFDKKALAFGRRECLACHTVPDHLSSATADHL